MYCYFGEEVYGVLGYLGYNFNAFADVLRDLPLKVKWINFQYSKDNFESKEDFYHLDDFIEVLKILVIRNFILVTRQNLKNKAEIEENII